MGETRLGELQSYTLKTWEIQKNVKSIQQAYRCDLSVSGPTRPPGALSCRFSAWSADYTD